jgi:hypothetical protein
MAIPTQPPQRTASVPSHAKRAQAWWRDLPLFWKRRIVLLAILGFGVAIPLTLLARSGSDDGHYSASTSAPIPQRFRLQGEVHLRDLGVSARVPNTWSGSRDHSTIRLRSGDRTTELAVTASAPAGRERSVLRSQLGAIRSGYRDASVKEGSGRMVGSLAAKGAVVSMRTRSGTAVRVLVAVASGDRHTYVVEVFSAANAPPERLIQAQLALRSLELTG